MNFKKNLIVIPNRKLETVIKLIIIFTMVIIVIVISFIAIKVFQANKNDNQYKQAESLISQKKWDEASARLNTIKGYKDSNTLITYVNAQQIFKANNKDYTPVITKLQEISLTYQGDFKEDIKKFKEELNLTVQAEARQKQITTVNAEREKINSIIQESINLLHSANYDKAIEKLGTKEFIDVPTMKNLSAYARAMKAVSNSDKNWSMTKELHDLNPDYAGPIANEIHSFVLKYTTIGEWRATYESTKN